MDCSLPGSSIQGLFQARILEWVAISFSRDLPDPGIEPRSPALQANSLPSEPSYTCTYILNLCCASWFQPVKSVVTVFAPRRCCASFRPGLRMISRLEGHEWQRPGWSSYFLRFLSGERLEDSGENRDGKENKSIPAWGAGRGENGDRLWELPANIWFPALLGGEEASLPKSGRPNTIAKATPIGPQTADTAAEPARHLGKPPK